MGNGEPGSHGMVIELSPIGIIHSPFHSLTDMPIQPTSKTSAEGFAEIFEPYRAGLLDLDGFSHVILLYYLHWVTRVDLQVFPFLDDQPRGIFATRAPTRPNPIGLSITRLKRIEAGHLYLDNIDILDGTPLLDIKPYVPEMDRPEDVTIGWLEGAKKRIRDQESDDRFQ